jgi:hypothetical protein
MSDIQPRGGSRPSRRDRADRAYRLVIATGGLGVAAGVGLVLAVLGVVGATWPIVLAVLAAVCGMLLRRTLGRG